MTGIIGLIGGLATAIAHGDTCRQFEEWKEKFSSSREGLFFRAMVSIQDQSVPSKPYVGEHEIEVWHHPSGSWLLHVTTGTCTDLLEITFKLEDRLFYYDGWVDCDGTSKPLLADVFHGWQPLRWHMVYMIPDTTLTTILRLPWAECEVLPSSVAGTSEFLLSDGQYETHLVLSGPDSFPLSYTITSVQSRGAISFTQEQSVEGDRLRTSILNSQGTPTSTVSWRILETAKVEGAEIGRIRDTLKQGMQSVSGMDMYKWDEKKIVNMEQYMRRPPAEPPAQTVTGSGWAGKARAAILIAGGLAFLLAAVLRVRKKP